MDFSTAYICVLAIWLTSLAVDAIDPNHRSRAQAYTRDEVNAPKVDIFVPTGRRCRRVGEKAARKRVSCVADIDFYEKLYNMVHKFELQPNIDDKSIKDLAFKISKCSAKYAKYFEIGCTFKSVYINERRRCRSLPTRQERTVCKANFYRRFHRRQRSP